MVASATSLDDRLHSALQSRQLRSIKRSLDHQTQSNPSVLPPLDFSSNDYLSFSHSISLKQNFEHRLLLSDISPFGPSSSRLLDGNTPQHLQLESDLTSFFVGQAGLLFNSGFDANVGIWSTLPGPQDYVLYDHLIHASVHDGLRGSRAPATQRLSFKHNSVLDLEQQLSKLFKTDPSLRSGSQNVFVAVESLYSMDGDLCPLQEMIEAIDRIQNDYHQQNIHLILDEAHSTGLYGESGRGMAVALSLSQRILVRLHTFGKAAACSGAIVITTPLIREYFINYARPLIFSTTMTRLNILAITTAMAEFNTENHSKAVSNLQTLATHLSNLLRNLLAQFSIEPVGPDQSRRPCDPITIPINPPYPPGLFSPIVPIISARPRVLAQYLLARGILVRPIGTPTVPAGREMVRICLHANQELDQLDYLVTLLSKWIIQEKKVGGVAHL